MTANTSELECSHIDSTLQVSIQTGRSITVAFGNIVVPLEFGAYYKAWD